jgi:hypothetical protein
MIVALGRLAARWLKFLKADILLWLDAAARRVAVEEILVYTWKVHLGKELAYAVDEYFCGAGVGTRIIFLPSRMQ